MFFGRLSVACALVVLPFVAVSPTTVCAQQQTAGQPVGQFVAALSLPEAPSAGFSAPVADSSFSSSSSDQPQAAAAAPEQSQRQKADLQVKEQEHQRVLGIMPSFNVSYRGDAVSLTAKQKIHLAARSAVDPFTFAGAFMIAGYHEARDDNKGFGWGIEGYGKRSGAAYLDSSIGTMLGNGIFPALSHQDPRYFRKGQAGFTKRLGYAVAMAAICKGDNGHWQFNYSNLAGNIAAGGISNLYYPSDGSGISQTFTNGLVVTAEGALGNIFQEFWPDVSRKLLHKDPTHGLDAQVAQEAQDAKADRNAKAVKAVEAAKTAKAAKTAQ
jgi:hypothetical protein